MGIGEAEAFSERLKRELQALEAANVHAILENEPLIDEVVFPNVCIIAMTFSYKSSSMYYPLCYTLYFSPNQFLSPGNISFRYEHCIIEQLFCMVSYFFSSSSIVIWEIIL